jgi:hypothetical protein
MTLSVSIPHDPLAGQGARRDSSRRDLAAPPLIRPFMAHPGRDVTPDLVSTATEFNVARLTMSIRARFTSINIRYTAG